MTRLTLKLVCILVSLAIFVTSCSSREEDPGQSSITITDQEGRVVTLQQMPQRLASLAPGNTEILFALGLGDKVVGVTSYCDFPAEAKEKPTIGGFSTVDIEKVVAQAPDLVLAANKHKTEWVPKLEELGINVIVLAPESIEEVMQAIEIVGQATGTKAASTKLVKEMQARLEAVDNLVNKLPEESKPNVFYALWHSPLRTAGHDTPQGQIIELAGGKNIFDELVQYPTVEFESMMEKQPQIIVAGVGHGSGQQAPLDWARSEPRLAGTEARINNRVFEIDANLVSRPGPRIIDGLEAMLNLIHPDLWAKL